MWEIADRRFVCHWTYGWRPSAYAQNQPTGDIQREAWAPAAIQVADPMPSPFFAQKNT